MKTLITILIIAAFLQTTILPIDLVLLVLICRAYIVRERANLYLAFVFGLLISHLNLTTLGLQSLVYLGIVAATQILSKTRLTGNSLLIVPISLVFLFLNGLGWPQIIFAAFLSLPVLYLIRLWEERFIVRKEIKLKI